ncbi:MAG: hypothetical protein AAGC74_00680 [Verrucomicrobiota bacterium]
MSNLSAAIWGYDSDLLNADALGVDLEADSLFRYQERICLVQLTDGETSVLVDPFEETTEVLSTSILGRAVWMHGADYDMALMKREWGGVPTQVWDTQIGARLLGSLRFGYAHLVEEYFGVELSKGSQKADWGRRPLPEKMAEYALNDVRYLIPLARKILQRLEEMGRTEWFEESCEWERQRALAREVSKEDLWRVKGSGKLDRRTLAFLKALWEWREGEAESWNRPSFMVATNKDLLGWALAAAGGKRLDLPRQMRSDRRKRLFEAMDETRVLPEESWPDKIRGFRRERDLEKEKQVDELLKRRERLAGELELEPAVIASRAALEGFVNGEDDRLMGWQASLLNL